MSNSRAIVIIGASGHGRVVADIVERAGAYTIAGWIDRSIAAGETVMGYPVLGDEDILPGMAARGELAGALVAIGDNFVRARVAARISENCPALRWLSVIHPAASVARDAVIGPGTVVMAGAVLNPGLRTGAFCIVNTGASADHDCVLEDYSSLAPGAVLGGNVHIGAYSAISLGAGVINGRHIGPHTVVGAGAMVLKDLPGHVLAYGVPARVIRPRQEGEKYL